MWVWFQRVLLGTLLERFGQHGIAVDASTLALSFHDDSVFRFPALDNRLRFKGEAHARLLREPTSEAWAALQVDLEAAWPDLVAELARFPVPDRVSVTRNEIRVSTRGDALVLRFDLVAD